VLSQFRRQQGDKGKGIIFLPLSEMAGFERPWGVRPAGARGQTDKHHGESDA
jgi:hypothetical protein